MKNQIIKYQFPNESDNNANVDNSNILNYTLPYGINKSYYILITLKSTKNGKIIFLPFYNLQLQSTYLRPNSKQLFNIFTKGTTTYTGHQRLDIYVPENETYNFEIVSLYGSGIIRFANDNFILFKNENLYSSNSKYSSYSSYSSYTGIINPSSIKYNLITIDVFNNDIKGLIFYIKYVWRSSKENFDEFESDKTTNIRYFNENIPQFPISLYTKVNKDDKDIIINFTLFNNSDADKGTFKVNSYIVDKDYILNRKKDLNYESINIINGDSFINNENLTGEVYFSEDAISSLNTKESKYVLLIISSEDSKYSGISLSIGKITNIVQSTEKKTEMIIPKTFNKYFTTTLKSELNVLKLRKDSIDDGSMKIIISLNSNYKVKLEEYNESTTIYDSIESLNDFTQEESKELGKSIYKIENLNETSIGVLLYIIINSTTNNELRLLDDENKKNYITIKYKTYSNDSVPTDDEISYKINNNNLTVNNESEEYLIVSFFSVNVEKNVSYTLNFYNKTQNNDNIEDFYSIFTDNPIYNFTNYLTNDDTITFNISFYDNNINNGEYIINVVANFTINDDEIESLVYYPISITISKKIDDKEEDSEETEEDVGESEEEFVEIEEEITEIEEDIIEMEDENDDLENENDALENENDDSEDEKEDLVKENEESEDKKEDLEKENEETENDKSKEEETSEDFSGDSSDENESEDDTGSNNNNDNNNNIIEKDKKDKKIMVVLLVW